jgi:hypothetical protein
MELSIPEPVDTVIHSPLFIKGVLIVGGIAVAIGATRYLAGRLFGKR